MWTTPATAVAGSILAASFWNAQVRDNLALVKTSISDDGLTWTGAWAPSGGTVTVSTPILDATQTWNAGAVTFTLLKVNVTDTASAAASLLIDLQVGGASKFKVTKAGQIQGVDGSAAVPFIAPANDTNTGLFSPAADALGVALGGTEAFRLLSTTGRLIMRSVGTVEWSSANIGDAADVLLSRGAAGTLDLDQLGNDGDIFRFKSSDVAHGITDFAPTSVYGTFGKASASNGGLMTTGYSVATETLVYRAFSTTVDTGAASAARVGMINYRAYKKSGTSVTAPDATAWLFAIGSQANARFLFREDGNFYSDGSHNPSAYDAFDDAMACRALDLTMAPDQVVESGWDAFVRYRRDDLIRMGVITEGGFICHTKHAKLLNGAIWQQRVQHMEMAKVVADLGARVVELERKAS